MHDPNEVAPNGLTYAEIDARQADYVRRANENLASLRNRGARWWFYSVSHQTFDMVVGDPLARDENLVICCPSTDRLCGPTNWPSQQLRVEWTCDRDSESIWSYRLIDEAAGFLLESQMFLWRRDYDIHANQSISFSRRAPDQKYFEFRCPNCQAYSFGYHPFCGECGFKLPSESRMYGVGLTRPVNDPARLLEIGYQTLLKEIQLGTTSPAEDN